MEQLVPGWSDAAAGDPAVALLELTSCLSTVQNQAINRLEERHYLAYLRLLGQSPRQLLPARLLAAPLSGGIVWPGMRFEVDGVPFEVTDAPRRELPRVEGVFLVQEGRRTPLREDTPLAVSPGLPGALEAALSAPLAPHMPAGLWLELQPEPGRTPPDAETAPPIRLTAQIWDSGWRTVSCEDETCGLLRSGYVRFTPQTAAERLRLLIRGEVEGEPRISAAALSPITLEQRRTRSQSVDLRSPFRIPRGWEGRRVMRFFLPQGGGWREEMSLFLRDGVLCGLPGGTESVRVVASEPDFPALHLLRELPGEEIRLEERGILPDTLRLMTEEDGIWYDCPVRQPEGERTTPRGCRWDASRSALRFGDGRDFSVPCAGQLLVAGCARTLGAGGNGAAGLLEQDGIALRPLNQAWGGQDAEDGKSAFFRAARALALPARAVSLSDYESLARRAPGLALVRVKAVPAAELGGAGPGVVVIALPRSPDPLPDLTSWQARRLAAWLEPFRLIGVPLEVRGPRYCPLDIRLRVRFRGPAAEQSLRAAAILYADGVTGPLEFGAEVSYTALFSAFSAVPGVEAVRALELRALSGNGRPTREGGIRLDRDTLPFLEQFHLTEE